MPTKTEIGTGRQCLWKPEELKNASAGTTIYIIIHQLNMKTEEWKMFSF